MSSVSPEDQAALEDIAAFGIPPAPDREYLTAEGKRLAQAIGQVREIVATTRKAIQEVNRDKFLSGPGKRDARLREAVRANAALGEAHKLTTSAPQAIERLTGELLALKPSGAHPTVLERARRDLESLDQSERPGVLAEALGAGEIAVFDALRELPTLSRRRLVPDDAWAKLSRDWGARQNPVVHARLTELEELHATFAGNHRTAMDTLRALSGLDDREPILLGDNGDE